MKKLILLLFIPLVFACNEDNDDTSSLDNTQLIDIDQNIYPVLEIADEFWTTQSLKTKTYRDGTSIPYVEDPVEWDNLTTGAWRYVNDDPSTEENYGLLYNFYAVNNPKGLAPEGSRIPSRTDFLHLTSYYGAPITSNPEEEIFLSFLTDDPEIPWNRDGLSFQGTNSTGFNLYPSGMQRQSFSTVTFFGYGALLYSSSIRDTDAAGSYPFTPWFKFNSSGIFAIGEITGNYIYGCSVRVIKE
tara:strand:- start:24 stop:752 length:729 start_codon:yes stop_codon:yes gene_type:complete